MKCFGVSNHSTQKVLTFLKSCKSIDSESEVAVVVSGKQLVADKAPSREILFFLNISDFYRNLPILNSKLYLNTQVFVFASALRIKEIKDCISLDSTPSPEMKGLITRLSQELDKVAYKKGLKVTSQEVKRLDTKFLTAIVDTVKRGSLLNPLMTFIYTLPSSTHQTPVKQICADYFYKGTQFDKLAGALKAQKGIFLKPKALDRLKDILTSEIGRNYQSLFKDYRSKKSEGKVPNLESLCKKHDTTPYEVRYLLSIVEENLSKGSMRGKSISALAADEQLDRNAKKELGLGRNQKLPKKSISEKPSDKPKVKKSTKKAASSKKAKIKTKVKKKKAA